MTTRALPLVLFLAAGVAAAQAPAHPALAESASLVAEGEFEKALKVLDVAVRGTKDDAQLARLHVARGQLLVTLGKPDAAKRAFTAALEKDSGVDLDRKRANPDAVALFDTVRAGFPATLEVKVTNGEANVIIDGKAMGPAPFSTELPPGRHRVEATSEDGRVVKADHEAVAGRRAVLALELPAPKKVVEGFTKPPEDLGRKTPKEKAPPAVRVETGPQRPWVALAPAGAGVAAVAAGAVLWLSSNSRVAALERRDSAAVGANPNAYAQAARVERVSGIGLVAAGSAAAVGGVLWFFLGGSDAPKATPVAFATESSFGLGVSGRLP